MKSPEQDHSLLIRLGLEEPDPDSLYDPSLDKRAYNKANFGHEDNSGIGTLVHGGYEHYDENPSLLERLESREKGASIGSLVMRSSAKVEGEKPISNAETATLDTYKREIMDAKRRGKSLDYVLNYLDHDARHLNEAETHELGEFLETVFEEETVPLEDRELVDQ